VLVFGVMLTATGPFQKIRTAPAEGLLASGIGLMFLTVVMSTVFAVDWSGLFGKAELPAGYNQADVGNTSRPLGLSFLGLRPDKDLQNALKPVEWTPPEAEVSAPMPDKDNEKRQTLQTTIPVDVGGLVAGQRYRFDVRVAANEVNGEVLVPRGRDARLSVQLTGTLPNKEAYQSQAYSAKAASLEQPRDANFYFELPAPLPKNLRLVARVENARVSEDEPTHLVLSDARINEVGRLSTGYLLPFEIVSVHLLVVLIGAAYLARAKRRAAPPSSAEAL
jgi:hypothetical protein